MSIPFQNQYSRLPGDFHQSVNPSPVAEPRWIAFNRDLAGFLGLDADALESDEGLAYFSGNRIPEGADPIAMAYAGHQFGGFVPQLGDGRAILLGEVIARDGSYRDIQLKGAGPTPFSRRGDGRSALGPVVREFLLSEGMAALGIPTTRALAAVWSGERVYREQVEPGGVFTRVASSHLRIGTVEFFAARQAVEQISTLVEFAIKRHYPDLADSPSPALALLETVSHKQASLVARWLGIGFIHGVMNTDNMSLSGETIDYGPAAFLDGYDPEKKFSYIDRQGRYAYGNQPAIVQWNLTRLAEAMLPLIVRNEEGDRDRAVKAAEEILNAFVDRFEKERDRVFARKLGFASPVAGVRPLYEEFLELLEKESTDFTVAFRRLANSVSPTGQNALLGLFSDPAPMVQWHARWTKHLEEAGIPAPAAEKEMMQSNPALIPRNHRVEEVIQAANEEDFAPFHRFLEALSSPFESRDEFSEYEKPPLPGEEIQRTFCGT